MVKKENTKRKKATAKKPLASKPKISKKRASNNALDSVYKGVNKPTLYNKAKAFVAKNTVMSILLVFILIGGFIIAINQVQAYQEKQQFNKAELALDELANNITNELGEPVSFEKEKFCAYRSDKFEDPGPPACSVSYAIVYKLSDNKIERLDSIALAADKSVESVSSVDSDAKLVENLDYNPMYSFDYYTDTKLIIDGVYLDCSIYMIEGEQINDLNIRMSCLAQDSKAQHFPVKD